MQAAKSLLPIIVLSQFAGTSLWFAGNAVLVDLPEVSTGFAGITTIVQFGFIAGTLIFSLLTIADRIRPAVVFFISSLIASASNLLIIWLGDDLTLLFMLRFITGFFLAGIYPVGMKIAADCFPGKLGNALGFLVGALVLGTAFPHIVRNFTEGLNWKNVLWCTSLLATAGGILILLFTPSYKNGFPAKPDLTTAFRVFRLPQLRAAAFGYFGHMWELYTFWAYVPVVIAMYHGGEQALNVPFWSFLIIAAGCLGCMAGGILSRKFGSKKIAFYSLMISGLCCLLSPFIFDLPEYLYLLFLLVWGLTVVSDSPQFSALVAQSAPRENKGTALTVVTCIGFAITIISIQVFDLLFNELGDYSFLVLAAGPAAGLLTLRKFKETVAK